MTREEAISKAINIVRYFEAHFAKSKEAREDAVNIIEALEQEPCEDAISRQAVLNLPRIALKNGFGEITAAIYIKDVEKLPPTAEKVEYNEPAQVELTGDGYADGQIVYEWGKCPNCGWEFEDGDKDWEEPYCCHCGQKLHWFETQEVEE
jgi:hypothetical protein